MATRTPLEQPRHHNGHHDSYNDEGNSIRSEFQQIVQDLGRLAWLQLRLLRANLIIVRARAIRHAIVVLASLVFVLGCIPIVVLGFAQLLIDYAGWSPCWAYLTVAGGILAVSGIAATFAARRVLQSFDALRPFREEWTKNVEWVTTLLKRNSP